MNSWTKKQISVRGEGLLQGNPRLSRPGLCVSMDVSPHGFPDVSVSGRQHWCYRTKSSPDY